MSPETFVFNHKRPFSGQRNRKSLLLTVEDKNNDDRSLSTMPWGPESKCLNLSFQVRKPVSQSDWDTGPSEPEQTETSATVQLPGRQDDRKALGSFYKPTEESRVNWVPQLVWTKICKEPRGGLRWASRAEREGTEVTASLLLVQCARTHTHTLTHTHTHTHS